MTYTPSFGLIRDAATEHSGFSFTYEEFDRAIAAHDREVAAAAWDEGYLRGQFPYLRKGEADPIPSGEHPPSSGPNANPWRAV